MFCTLVQLDAAPTVDQLRRAFKLLKTFTEADATKLANEACGLLVKNLSRDDATTLQRALQADGVPTEIVEPGRLPKLPDAKFVRRLDIQPQALTIFDPLGRTVPVDWQHLCLISAGSVRHFGVSTTRTEVVGHGFSPVRGFQPKVVTEVRHKIQDDSRIVIDIFLAQGTMRFQIEAESFPFKYSFDRPELDLPQKAGLLVQMLTQQAPQAHVNRGAAALRDNSPGAAAYASKAALFDESVWLLWRMKRLASL
jgi:hypothetical protein